MSKYDLNNLQESVFANHPYMGKLLGIVLAGGKSTRMGRNKALLKPWGASGPTLLEHAFQLLQEVTGEALVSCAQGASFQGFPCLEDRRAACGPAEGVRLGLERAASLDYEGIFALAVDLPLFTGEMARRLVSIAERDKDAWVICYQPPSGKLQMLVAIYRCLFLPHLDKSLDAGERSLFRLAPERRRLCVPYTWAESPLFHNCNTPEDLALCNSL